MSKNYTDYIDNETLNARISFRFPALDAAEQEQLASIITRAKVEQLQTLTETRLKPLLESLDEEPEQLNRLIEITVNVPETARNLISWEATDSRSPHPDTQLYTALQEAGHEEYYSFCANLRHEYLLNKEARSYEDGGLSSLADKLLAKGHGHVTKYITANPLRLDDKAVSFMQQLYPVEMLQTHQGRLEPNGDFSLTSREIERAVIAILPQLVRELESPALSEPQPSPVTYSDPMAGDLTVEKYAEKVNAIQMAQNRQLVIRAIESGDSKALIAVFERFSDKQKPQLLRSEDAQGETFLNRMVCNKNIITALPIILPPEQWEEFRVTANGSTGSTPLHLAIKSDNHEAIPVLFAGLSPEQRMELLRKVDNEENTAMYLAIKSGQYKAVPLLFEGLSPEQRFELLSQTDSYEQIALHQAASNGHSRVISLLFEGLSSERRQEILLKTDEAGNTPLHYAAQEGHSAVIGVLLEHLTAAEKSAVINQRDVTTYAYTALHKAASGGHDRAVTELLEHGADATLRCDRRPSRKIMNKIQLKGATAADLARNNGHNELADMLQQAKNAQQGRAASWMERIVSRPSNNIERNI